METVLEARDVTRSYRMDGGVTLDVLRGVSLTLQRGEQVAIVGSSGSGKSTLLHVLGALDTPSSGEVRCGGQVVSQLSSKGRDRLRCTFVGFVFQFYHLLPDLNVLENVVFPRMIASSVWRWPSQSATARRAATDLLRQVGLEGRLKHRPNELSGGERQRVAIARALVNQPAVLLADEPTGNLDKSTGRGVLAVLHDLHRRGQTMILVTHDPDVAQAADRVLRLEDGRLGPA